MARTSSSNLPLRSRCRLRPSGEAPRPLPHPSGDLYSFPPIGSPSLVILICLLVIFWHTKLSIIYLVTVLDLIHVSTPCFSFQPRVHLFWSHQTNPDLILFIPISNVIAISFSNKLDTFVYPRVSVFSKSPLARCQSISRRTIPSCQWSSSSHSHKQLLDLTYRNRRHRVCCPYNNGYSYLVMSIFQVWRLPTISFGCCARTSQLILRGVKYRNK